VEFFGAFISGILSTVTYVIIFLGVYKLYYIAKDIHEIKELMDRKLRNSVDVAAPSRAVAPAVAPELAKNLSEEDAASAYAEQLLRAVNAEAPSRMSETHEVR
jgi:hypothetical protein